MASAKQSKKLRILLVPFFATSHINPFTDLAFHLATSRPEVVEATIAVTPANASVVRSALARRGPTSYAAAAVKVATYAFPAVQGLPPGVENLSTAKVADSWRIDVAAFDEALMRPGQESVVREISPDVIITDIHFFWNVDVAADLGVPCITFYGAGTFPTLAMRHIMLAGGVGEAAVDGVVTIPRFPAPEIRVPVTELPEFLRSRQQVSDPSTGDDPINSATSRCFGIVVSTFFDLECGYCELYVANGYVKRAYFLGPLSLPLLPQQTTTNASSTSQQCIDWLDKKLDHSVLYLCFGSFAHVTDAQLHELAMGLEASGKPFLWVVRSDSWAPSEEWTDRVGDRGMVVTGWAPQTAILSHRAIGAFVTHCGWNSILETVVAGVPVLTWPLVFEQFITERFVSQVLGIGARLCPEGAGVRSTRYQENELISADVVVQSIATFMEPGGAGDSARSRVKELSAKARAAMADGGSSHRDLSRFIDDLIEARSAGAGTTLS
ncbi:hypothetical protein PR202_ga05572 [Eleusine coracana subsp. coracana]|uniref:Glycosyltransferase n=1 Tax=Eleusine coracana subsp. coracana TaxID=191504 RepID=A0AAV5BSS5_ELECO|nr:hypothetical protein QOZ80_5AG0367810 [Eleusine coracana subsp. coracana]GJM88982.1 hypothetical protein PR202_ga05118 [Eleusine coracana subsp. coracana]GJM89383.1 hypothetical protein PR202_ga05572 [Eleusine coracana subsp. coracana]